MLPAAAAVSRPPARPLDWTAKLWTASEERIRIRSDSHIPPAYRFWDSVVERGT